MMEPYFVYGNESVQKLIRIGVEHGQTPLWDGHYDIVFFIDSFRSFDVVDCNILMAKLERYGQRGLPLKPIQT